MTTTHSQSSPPRELSTAELIERLGTQLTELIRTELSSAAAEVKSKSTRLGTGIGVSGAGLIIILFGLGTLVAAATLGLATVVSGWLAALIVGAVLVVLGAGTATLGASRARDAVPPLPEHTVESVRTDTDLVKEHL